ncbi:pentatricopeptide repeat-containing protein At3g24000, mitochondrial-like [Oryza glaberrima]|uniref:pentatricopeptide repeat-containing protein At3g24000, mitochondrial-like n=1 Tax=Oryza glaberrima TaxID=4538 RepID=UPI00224C5DDB|nr:pentatricopeptide repeat-containing protein At3g24000, mitochondrial-like [Oryza glaberrima]
MGWGERLRPAASPASGRSHGCGSRTLVTSRTWTRCGSNVVVDSALVDMYLKCSSPEDARWMFAAVAARNITMWTTVLSGHSQHGRVAEALALFDQMMRVDRLRPNDVTFLTFEGLANLSNDGALVMQTGAGGRYSLLVHHSVEELRVFGLTDDMIEDQKFASTPSSSILLNRWR